MNLYLLIMLVVLKWPNDILIDGKKISGILIEYAQSYVIIGIGINKIIKYQGKSAELIGLNESGALVLRTGTKYILTYGDEIVV